MILFFQIKYILKIKLIIFGVFFFINDFKSSTKILFCNKKKVVFTFETNFKFEYNNNNKTKQKGFVEN